MDLNISGSGSVSPYANNGYTEPNASSIGGGAGDIGTTTGAGTYPNVDGIIHPENGFWNLSRINTVRSEGNLTSREYDRYMSAYNAALDTYNSALGRRDLADPITQANQLFAHANDFAGAATPGAIVKPPPPTGLMQPAPEVPAPLIPPNLPEPEAPLDIKPVSTMGSDWNVKFKPDLSGLVNLLFPSKAPAPYTPTTAPSFTQLDLGSPIEAYKSQPATGLMDWKPIGIPRAKTANTDYLNEYGVNKGKTVDALQSQMNPVTGLMQTETPADKKARLDKAAYLPEQNTYLKDYKLGWQAYA